MGFQKVHTPSDIRIFVQTYTCEQNAERVIDQEPYHHIHLKDFPVKIRFHIDKNAGCPQNKARRPISSLQHPRRNRIPGSDANPAVNPFKGTLVIEYCPKSADRLNQPWDEGEIPLN